MAHVVKSLASGTNVDRYYLDYLLREWSSLPEIRREWPTWGEEDRLRFVLEWPTREYRLAQLQEWESAGVLTPEQMTRHRELQILTEKYRPIVEPLLSEDDPTIPRRVAR